MTYDVSTSSYAQHDRLPEQSESDSGSSTFDRRRVSGVADDDQAMNGEVLTIGYDDSEELADDYRRLSPAAAASMVLGLASALVFIDWMFLVVAVAGVTLGALGWLSIRRYPAELTGMGLAVGGIAASLLLGAGGTAYQIYSYIAEVPPGHTRINFEMTQTPEANPSEPADEIAALSGQKVFVKGYMRAAGLSYTDNLETFKLVKDNGACCFGDQTPAVGDMIQVKLVDPLRVDYSTRVFRVAGTLRVEWDPRSGVLYHLEADHIQ